MNPHTPMVILDARNKEWDDGLRIPGAKSLPYDSSPSLFSDMVPEKNTLIVIYCGSTQCPTGDMLAEKMSGEGYSYILKYAGGITEWGDEMNYPIETQ